MQNKEDTSEKASPWWKQGMLFFGQVTGWIVGPIVIALFAGRYLDRKYESEPLFFLGLTALAFIITCIGIVKMAMQYMKEIEKEKKENGDNSN